MSEAESDANKLVQMINKYGAMFDVLCVERHEKGAEEYGQLTFLGNDVVRMMMEELADTANYCRYQYIKLMFLQNQLENRLRTEGLAGDGEDVQLDIGWEPMKGTKDVGWDG